MNTAICSFDTRSTELLAIVFGILWLLAKFRAQSYYKSAEKHLDAKHWAGLPPSDGLANYWYHFIRTNVGLGYTTVGRRHWWAGAKWVFLTLLLFVVGILASVLRLLNC